MLQFASKPVRPMGRLTARTLTDDQMQSVSGGDDQNEIDDGSAGISGKFTKVHTSVDVDFEDGNLTD